MNTHYAGATLRHPTLSLALTAPRSAPACRTSGHSLLSITELRRLVAAMVD